MKRIVSVLLALVLVLTFVSTGLLHVAVQAEPAWDYDDDIFGDPVTTGTCGDNLTWNLDDDGTLTISGTGAMTSYTAFSNVPWYNSCSAIKKVVVGEGVTGIGTYAFSRCTGLTGIYFDGSAPTFGNNVFGGVTAAAYYYPDETWTEDVRQNYGGNITWVALKKAPVVTFKDESGNVISQAEYAEGEQIKAPTVDEIVSGRFAAYIFAGWGENYTGICQGDAEYTAIGTGYGDLKDALDDATQTGATAVLTRDISQRSVVVREGVTLDLNGHVLTADYLTCFDQVVDGNVGGNALVKVGKGIHLATENAFLPIYDTAAGGYRLYAYQLQNLGFKAVQGNADSLKCGFRLVLSNTDGYSVLANTTDVAIDTMAYLKWTGFVGEFVYTFSDSTLRNYAALAAADIAASGTTGKAITLTITGITRLGDDATISMRPAMDTAPGVAANTNAATWTTI